MVVSLMLFSSPKQPGTRPAVLVAENNKHVFQLFCTQPGSVAGCVKFQSAGPTKHVASCSDDWKSQLCFCFNRNQPGLKPVALVAVKHHVFPQLFQQ